MSVHVSAWVWDHSEANNAARLVALALADRADTESGECFPSVDDIAARCKLNRRQVFRHLATLKELGEITVRQQWRGPMQSVSVYCFHKYLLSRGVSYVTPRGGVKDTQGVAKKTPLNIDEPSKENLRNFPSVLAHSEKFSQSWQEWTAYRVEMNKPVGPTARKKQLSFLAGMGADAASACIEESIRNQWQGLFPLKVNGYANGNGNARAEKGDGYEIATKKTLSERNL